MTMRRMRSVTLMMRVAYRNAIAARTKHGDRHGLQDDAVPLFLVDAGDRTEHESFEHCVDRPGEAGELRAEHREERDADRGEERYEQPARELDLARDGFGDEVPADDARPRAAPRGARRSRMRRRPSSSCARGRGRRRRPLAHRLGLQRAARGGRGAGAAHPAASSCCSASACFRPRSITAFIERSCITTRLSRRFGQPRTTDTRVRRAVARGASDLGRH